MEFSFPKYFKPFSFPKYYKSDIHEVFSDWVGRQAVPLHRKGTGCVVLICLCTSTGKEVLVHPHLTLIFEEI